MVAKKPAKKTASRRSSKPADYNASSEELLQFYKDMLLVRRFEEKAGQMYGMGLIGGFCHLYIGQEAVLIGIHSAMEDGDDMITSYRAHGHAVMSGLSPRAVMAELTGRSGGCSKGKGGSMHMYNPEGGFYGGHGIVGAQVSLGTGLAFAHKYKKSDRVNICFYGDGAAHQGQVYESYNMAALWQLPVVYIIENNQYAMGTSVARSSKETELYRRGEGFGIPGEEVDGMNVLAVREATDRAIKHCRDGKGPYILEMKTYRYRGHSMSDPAKYRSKDEVKKMRSERDAIEQLKEKILVAGAADEASLKEMDKEIKQIVADAAEYAQQSPEPEMDQLYADILAGTMAGGNS